MMMMKVDMIEWLIEYLSTSVSCLKETVRALLKKLQSNLGSCHGISQKLFPHRSKLYEQVIIVPLDVANVPF